MKLTTLFIALFLIACTSKEDITPASIVGKWSPTYITQTRQADGTFDAWHRINTFALLPVYEFTSDGRFLKDGKPGGECCLSGSKYSVSSNNIIFDDRPICPTVKCASYDWAIIEIKGDTLTLDEFRTRNKYVRLK
jgi:hypothetical protein